MIAWIVNTLKRVLGFLSGIPWEPDESIFEKEHAGQDSSLQETVSDYYRAESGQTPFTTIHRDEVSIVEAPISVVSGLPDVEQIISKWKVSTGQKSPFEKVGRIYREGSSLVIRSQVDKRGFSVDIDTMNDILDGETGAVISLEDGRPAGTARLSVSGKAVNFRIEPFFYTTPLKSLLPIIEGKKRKGPLFVGREQVEPG